MQLRMSGPIVVCGEREKGGTHMSQLKDVKNKNNNS